MGLNLDLTEMMGMPSQVICPSCHEKINTYFDDFDIDTPNSNPGTGKWINYFECGCGAELEVEVQLSAIVNVRHVE